MVSEHGVLPGLWPIHGDGVLARQGELVLLIHPAGGAFTDRLLDLLAEAARVGESGRRFVDLVSAEFDSDAVAAPAAGDEHGPAAVAFGPAGGGKAITVYGTAWAEVTTAHGVLRLTAGQPHGRLRCVLPSEVIKLRASVRAADTDLGTDPYLRLADGVVRAVALVYAPEGAAGAEAEAADLGKQAAFDRAAALDWSWGEQAAPGNAMKEALSDQVEPAASQKEDAGLAKQAASQKEDAGRAERAASQKEDAGRAERAASQKEDAGRAKRAASQKEDAGRAKQEVRDAGNSRPGDSSKRDFISLSLGADEAGGDVPRRNALPLGAEPPDEKDLRIAERLPPAVDGVYCKNGHFNDPEARFCAVCGIGMGQLTKVRQGGKRPPLGVLVLDDGSVCQLDADYVMGREPTLDTSVADGQARPLRLVGASGLVSRIHARVELDGWQVFISDLNSANGTEILLPGERSGTSLAPGVRTPLVAGAQIRLGGEYGIRYDSHRHR
jgi:hypothetical protein